MKKMYLSAPLPFVGQKRMFAKQFIDVIKKYPDDTIFVDLFGGSGLLSHIAKFNKPNSTVVYNDFDNYRLRLGNIPRTNKLLRDLREIVKDVPRSSIIKGEPRNLILERLEREQREFGFIDFITISASLLFSGKYKTNLEEFYSSSFYNRVRSKDIEQPDRYLDGLEISSCDYRVLFNKYKDNPHAVFIIDPPYLGTDVKTYNMSWGLKDYLDVLTVLDKHRFIYFTSNKTSIVELCAWMHKHKNFEDPFANCKNNNHLVHLNYECQYSDIMLYNEDFKSAA